MSSLPDDRSACRDAFLTQFLRHQGAIQAFVYAAVRDRVLADDLIQEVAAALWSSFDRYSPDRPFAPWARGVARNILRSHYGKHARGAHILAPDAVAAMADAAMIDDGPGSVEAEWALRRCVSKLPARSERLLSLRYERSLDLPSIASEVGIGIEGVRKALARLRRRLKSCIEKQLRKASAT